MYLIPLSCDDPLLVDETAYLRKKTAWRHLIFALQIKNGMSYEEYNRYCELLKTWRSDTSKEDNISIKLETLDKFRATGGSTAIHFLVKFLRDDHERIRQRRADVVMTLFDNLKSGSQLYESLKYLSIARQRVQ